MKGTPNDQIVIAGHRGAMAHAPENSIKSFQLAADSGADEVELDVHLSRDGVLVINHDNVVDRTTDGSGLIAAQRWSELAKLRIHGVEPICTFDDVIDQLPGLAMQVEVKDVHAIEPVLDLMRSDESLRDRSIVTSFNAKIIDHVQSSGVPVRYGRILRAHGGGKLSDFPSSGVHRAYVRWDVAQDPVVERFRQGGGLAGVWLCNDVESIRRAIDEGFDGLTTNDPALAVAIRDRYVEGQ